jgi:hypothetical protein
MALFLAVVILLPADSAVWRTGLKCLSPITTASAAGRGRNKNANAGQGDNGYSRGAEPPELAGGSAADRPSSLDQPLWNEGTVGADTVWPPLVNMSFAGPQTISCGHV